MASRHEPSYDSDDAPHKGRVAVGGGEVGAKHWYLQRFPAIKALKPLYTTLTPKSIVFDQLSKLHVVVFWVAKECCVLHICYVFSQ